MSVDLPPEPPTRDPPLPEPPPPPKQDPPPPEPPKQDPPPPEPKIQDPLVPDQPDEIRAVGAGAGYSSSHSAG